MMIAVLAAVVLAAAPLPVQAKAVATSPPTSPAPIETSRQDYRARVQRLYATRDMASKLTQVDRLIELYPSVSGAFGWAGIIYSAAHRRVEAIRFYDRALALGPSAEAFYNRGLTRPKSDLDGRQGDVDAALALDTKLGAFWAERAHIALARGDAAGAAAALDEAIARDPDDPDLLVDRGLAYLKAGDPTRAHADITAATALPADAEARDYWCRLKAQAGVELASGLADCDVAVAAAPGSATFLDDRGFVLLRLGRFDDAIRDFSAALKLDPRRPTALVGRAVAAARSGDRRQADADLAAAAAIDPYVRDDFAFYGVTPW